MWSASGRPGGTEPPTKLRAFSLAAETGMRTMLLRLALVLGVLGVTGLAVAQTGADPQSTIASLVAANPAPTVLAAAIAAAVAADPSLASAVATFAATATPAQQNALCVGLAQAIASLGTSKTAAVQTVENAIASSPAATV